MNQPEKCWGTPIQALILTLAVLGRQRTLHHITAQVRALPRPTTHHPPVRKNSHVPCIVTVLPKGTLLQHVIDSRL